MLEIWREILHQLCCRDRVGVVESADLVVNHQTVRHGRPFDLSSSRNHFTCAEAFSTIPTCHIIYFGLALPRASGTRQTALKVDAAPRSQHRWQAKTDSGPDFPLPSTSLHHLREWCELEESVLAFSRWGSDLSFCVQ